MGEVLIIYPSQFLCWCTTVCVCLVLDLKFSGVALILLGAGRHLKPQKSPGGVLFDEVQFSQCSFPGSGPSYNFATFTYTCKPLR